LALLCDVFDEEQLSVFSASCETHDDLELDCISASEISFNHIFQVDGTGLNDVSFEKVCDGAFSYDVVIHDFRFCSFG
jgi:hypothetical protein